MAAKLDPPARPVWVRPVDQRHVRRLEHTLFVTSWAGQQPDWRTIREQFSDLSEDEYHALLSEALYQSRLRLQKERESSETMGFGLLACLFAWVFGTRAT